MVCLTVLCCTFTAVWNRACTRTQNTLISEQMCNDLHWTIAWYILYFGVFCQHISWKHSNLRWLKEISEVGECQGGRRKRNPELGETKTAFYSRRHWKNKKVTCNLCKREKKVHVTNELKSEDTHRRNKSNVLLNTHICAINVFVGEKWFHQLMNVFRVAFFSVKGAAVWS